MKDNISNYLETDKDNLIRIDIILKSTIEKVTPKNNFSWLSLNKSGVENISVYESVKQAIDNPETNPIKRNNGVIHTIFIKTLEYK